MDAHTFDSMGERTQRFPPLVRRAKLQMALAITVLRPLYPWHPFSPFWESILVLSDTFHGPWRAQVRTSQTRKRITRKYLKAHDSKGMIHLYFINFTTYGSLVNLRLRNLYFFPFSYPLGSNGSQAGMLEGLGILAGPRAVDTPGWWLRQGVLRSSGEASLSSSGCRFQSHGCLVTHVPEVISPLYLFVDVWDI